MGSRVVVYSSARKEWLTSWSCSCRIGLLRVERLVSNQKVLSPGIEPGLRPSQSRVLSGTLREHGWLIKEPSNPPRNRTWSDSFEDCHAIQHTRESYRLLVSHKSRRLGSHQHEPLYKSGAFLHRATSAGFVRISSLTRNRTRNFWLEARDDVRFTIEPFCKQAEGKGVEPS